MTKQQESSLNHFFVTTFNQILAWEERALQKAEIKNLSVKELHIIEAVAGLEESNHNTMSYIAGKINISVGALTTAVNTIVKKGYLERGSEPMDRRIVKIYLTDSGHEAEKKHAIFHRQMMEEVGRVLDENSLVTLTDSLRQLTMFFENY